MCLCVCVCWCVRVRPRLDPNWLWLHFHRIFSRREAVQGPDGEMGSEGETHLPFPDTVLSRVCGHTDTHARTQIVRMVSSITWGISITNEVWEGDRSGTSGWERKRRIRETERVRKSLSWCRVICDKGRVRGEVSEGEESWEGGKLWVWWHKAAFFISESTCTGV